MQIKSSVLPTRAPRVHQPATQTNESVPLASDSYTSSSSNWDDIKGSALMVGIWAGVSAPLVVGTVGGAIHGYARGGIATAAWQGAVGMLAGGVATGALLVKLIEGGT